MGGLDWTNTRGVGLNRTLEELISTHIGGGREVILTHTEEVISTHIRRGDFDPH